MKKIDYWRAQVDPTLRHPASYVAYYNGKHLRAVVSELLKKALIPQLKKLVNRKDIDKSAKKVILNYLEEMEQT